MTAVLGALAIALGASGASVAIARAMLGASWSPRPIPRIALLREHTHPTVRD